MGPDRRTDAGGFDDRRTGRLARGAVSGVKQEEFVQRRRDLGGESFTSRVERVNAAAGTFRDDAVLPCTRPENATVRENGKCESNVITPRGWS